jgi:predicted KAP-like P-loop ATPase
MIPADNPIESSDQDELGRVRVAETLAREILSLDASAGCVVGILGPWGSGKTSLLNLMRGDLKKSDRDLAILEFNPWMFSGTDELLQTFFIEVGAQFRGRTDRLAELANDIEAYGEIVAPLRLLPVIGVWVERARSAIAAVKKALERRKGGALANRKRLAEKLAALQTPIVLVIDDIDRLHTEEIREIFKLVRLTASFPNIIYVLAFDRHRVETALSEEGLNGRDYLEKILQVAYDIPAIPPVILTRSLTTAIDASLKDIDDHGPFDRAAWPDVLFEIVRPLIRNVRDVRRSRRFATWNTCQPGWRGGVGRRSWARGHPRVPARCVPGPRGCAGWPHHAWFYQYVCTGPSAAKVFCRGTAQSSRGSCRCGAGRHRAVVSGRPSSH